MEFVIRVKELHMELLEKRSRTFTRARGYAAKAPPRQIYYAIILTHLRAVSAVRAGGKVAAPYRKPSYPSLLFDMQGTKQGA
jgi:hypothetical protein